VPDLAFERWLDRSGCPDGLAGLESGTLATVGSTDGSTAGDLWSSGEPMFCDIIPPVVPKVFCVTKGEKPLSKGWDAMMKVWDETQARRSTMIDEHKTVVYRQFPSSGLGEHFMGMMENMDMEKYAQWVTEPEFKVIEEKSGVKQTDYDLFELKQFSEAEFATLPDFIPYLVFKIPISKGYDRFMQVFQAEGALRQKCCNDVETRVGFASDPSCMLLLFTNVVKAAALQIMGDPVVNKNWADNGIVLNEREFFYRHAFDAGRATG